MHVPVEGRRILRARKRDPCRGNEPWGLKNTTPVEETRSRGSKTRPLSRKQPLGWSESDLETYRTRPLSSPCGANATQGLKMRPLSRKRILGRENATPVKEMLPETPVEETNPGALKTRPLSRKHVLGDQKHDPSRGNGFWDGSPGL